MKKILIVFSVLIVFSTVSYAQSLYIRVGGGYGLPIGTTSIGEKYQYDQVSISNTTSTSSVKNVKASYGAGGNFNFSIGYTNTFLSFALTNYFSLSILSR